MGDEAIDLRLEDVAIARGLCRSGGMRAFLALVPLVLSSCAGVHGSGAIVQVRADALPGFHEVDLAGGLHASIRRGPPGVVLEGDDNIVAEYEVKVEGERLLVHPRADVALSPSRPVHAFISLPDLRKVVATGGVDVLVENGVSSSLALELSGGVEFEAKDVKLAVLQVQASGGVEVDLSGAAENVDLHLSGGVDFDAKDLTAQTVILDASGGCDVDVVATESISGAASGGVDVTVRGNPPKSRVAGSGGASIEWKD
ncbi:MAG: head GIN domain-containing protein [Myxococcota bacterium]